MSETTSSHTCAKARRDFKIIDETNDYIVVDKPAPLLVHPTKPNGTVTLWEELGRLLAFEIASGGQISIVNRLDRETSGIVLVAKTSEAARQFGLLMQTRRIRKEYHALVWGWPEWNSTTVQAPIIPQREIGSSSIHLKQTIDKRGAAAVTKFHVERRLERRTTNGDRFALIKADPQTGRMHQIRVHLASVGHPVVGDKLYGPDEDLYLRFIETGWTPALARELLLDRQALHASRLTVDARHDWTSALPVEWNEWL